MPASPSASRIAARGRKPEYLYTVKVFVPNLTYAYRLLKPF